MITENLSPLLDTSLFNNITSELINWNYSLVEGAGFHLTSTGEKYGHIALKIYKSEDYYNYVKWNIPKEQMPPDFDFQRYVIKALDFFRLHLDALKGEPSQPLIFEICDVSFHLIDSIQYAYGIATIKAFVNCFDKSFNLSDYQKEMIKGAKKMMTDYYNK